jgi:hypothetical protein
MFKFFQIMNRKKNLILCLGKYSIYNKNIFRIVFNIFEILTDRDTDKQSTQIKIQTFTCHKSNIPQSVIDLHWCYFQFLWAGLPRVGLGPPAGADQLKIFTLNQKKTDSQLQNDLDLVWKG